MGGNPSSRTIVTFKKNGTQTFTASGNTVTGKINYIVNSGSILDLGTSTVLGNDFNVNSGGALMIGSSNGIAASGATGNVQVIGARSFSSNGNYTYNGASAQATGSGLPATVNNLTINNSSGVTLTATVAVPGILTLTSGKLTTSSFEVNVTNTSTSAIAGYGTTNYIIGNLRRSVATTGIYDFPLGNSTYELATMKLNSATGISNFISSFTSGLPATMPSYVTCYVNGSAINGMLNGGYWTITPNSSTTVNYDITLNETGFSNFSGNAMQLAVIKRHDASQPWAGTSGGPNGLHSNATQSISGGTAIAKRTSVTTFSDYGIGYSSNILPILLSSFTATLMDNRYTSLMWVTSAELNNAYFDIERSADGKNYAAIGKVDGHGTSLVKNEYSFKDESPLTGTSYYRLKQVDFDKKFSYSPIQSIINSTVTLSTNDISVYPNPATSAITVTVQMRKQQTSAIQILDITGRKAYSQSIDFNEGQNQFKLPLNDLPAGIYFVSIGGETVTPLLKKFIKN